MSEPVVPDLSSPLDAEERIAAVPEDAEARGMFFQEIIDAVAKAGLPPLSARRSYVAFKSYPVREYLPLLVEGARALHPTLPLRRALYETGHVTYPNFAETMVGKAIFALAGREFRRVVEAAPRAYDAAVKGGKVEVLSLEEGKAVVGLRGIWPFPDCFQIGVWRGAMVVCDAVGDIKVAVHSMCDVDLHITWRTERKR